jgi:hypothetical protein
MLLRLATGGPYPLTIGTAAEFGLGRLRSPLQFADLVHSGAYRRMPAWSRIYLDIDDMPIQCLVITHVIAHF